MQSSVTSHDATPQAAGHLTRGYWPRSPGQKPPLPAAARASKPGPCSGHGDENEPARPRSRRPGDIFTDSQRGEHYLFGDAG